MAAPLTGLGSRPTIPDLPRCACGCGRDGPFGFPGDVHYAHACVPGALRYPWEAGYAAPAVEAALPERSAIPVPIAAAAIPDLFAGPVPA